MKKIGSIFVSLLAVCTLIGVLTACSEKQPDRTWIPLSDEDLSVLEQWHPSEPTVDEDFEDNKVVVAFRSAYDDLKEVGFQDFSAVNQVAGIASIEYCSSYPYRKITKRYEKLTLSVTTQHLFELELGIHDKEKVIEACSVLNQLDMVLLARPDYRQYAKDLWVPSDTLYDEQWALNGTYGIQAEQAWNYTRGNTDIKVGILEHGADLSHEDLRGRISQGNLSSMSENIDHGTHVAGI